MKYLNIIYFLYFVAASAQFGDKNFLKTFLQCETIQPTGQVSDCNCEFSTIDSAVSNFFTPILENLASKTFFRHFRVDLDRSCPFWQEDRQCSTETCSVCTCGNDDIPSSWLHIEEEEEKKAQEEDFGWVSSSSAVNDNLGKLEFPSKSALLRETEDEINDKNYVEVLNKLDEARKYYDESFEWVDMSEAKVSDSGSSDEVYVNLLENPERYTGYSGPSATRVWSTIMHENCFGGADDVCIEKRVFHRLISGLRSSISTHIARQYQYPDGSWRSNIPLFTQAVGSHVDRLNDLYFAFLVVLRAVAKLSAILPPIAQGGYRDSDLYGILHTGNTTDDVSMHHLLYSLAASLDPYSGVQTDDGTSTTAYTAPPLAVQQALAGFNESKLFQVSPDTAGATYAAEVHEKTVLLKNFRDKFRNISRVMDCVDCEKCRLWGKLQILGIGTAVKLLLLSQEEIEAGMSHLIDGKLRVVPVVNRQEIIALINVLNNLAKSVDFANHAAELEVAHKLSLDGVYTASTTYPTMLLFAMSIICMVILLVVLAMKGSRARKSA